jgi:hypothetical protein
MATLTNEQIEQKKQQLKQLAEEMKALKDELVEAGAWPMDEDELDKVAGGLISDQFPTPHITIHHKPDRSFYKDSTVYHE